MILVRHGNSDGLPSAIRCLHQSAEVSAVNNLLIHINHIDPNDWMHRAHLICPSFDSLLLLDTSILILLVILCLEKLCEAWAHPTTGERVDEEEAAVALDEDLWRISRGGEKNVVGGFGFVASEFCLVVSQSPRAA